MKIDKPSESELSEKTKLNKDPLKKKKLLIQKQKQKEDVQKRFAQYSGLSKTPKEKKTERTKLLKTVSRQALRLTPPNLIRKGIEAFNERYEFQSPIRKKGQ